jgi:predicted nucleic acid-binding protein
VGILTLEEGVARHERVGIDSCVFIYYLEDDPAFGPAAHEVLSRLVHGKNLGVASAVAMLEIMVGPFAHRSVHDADEIVALLQSLPGFRWIPLDTPLACRAAKLRAEQPGLRTPDAIHLATALEAGATLFVTNDRRLPQIDGLDYALLASNE